MPIAKAERLLDLVIALLNAPRYRSAAWIRRHVAGYDDAAGDDAFARMFERDKAELRDLGIPIETEPGGDGYLVRPGEFALPPMTFTAAESAALAVASRLWETTALAEAGSTALRKIRDAADATGGTRVDGAPAAGLNRAPAAGADDRETGGPSNPESDGGGAAGPTSRGPGGPPAAIRAQVKTPDASFGDLLTAVRTRRAVRFDYRAARDVEVRGRRLQPWGLVNYRGSWYAVGRDVDRDATRTFRLSRIVGTVRLTGGAGAFTVPADVHLMDEVVAADSAGTPTHALLRVRAGAAAGLRRGARALSSASEPDGFDEIRLPIDHLDRLARKIAGAGPDVVVVDPPELRAAVVALLRGVVASVGAAGTAGGRTTAPSEGH